MHHRKFALLFIFFVLFRPYIVYRIFVSQVIIRCVCPHEICIKHYRFYVSDVKLDFYFICEWVDKWLYILIILPGLSSRIVLWSKASYHTMSWIVLHNIHLYNTSVCVVYILPLYHVLCLLEQLNDYLNPCFIVYFTLTWTWWCYINKMFMT